MKQEYSRLYKFTKLIAVRFFVSIHSHLTVPQYVFTKMLKFMTYK